MVAPKSPKWLDNGLTCLCFVVTVSLVALLGLANLWVLAMGLAIPFFIVAIHLLDWLLSWVEKRVGRS